MDEKRLWFELDKIATVEAGAGMNMAKSDAAVAMMKFLERPSHEECRQMYAASAELGVRYLNEKRM